MDGTPQRFAAPIAVRGLIAALIAVSASGCAYDPKRFQLPQLWSRHPDVERRIADYHDAFPDDTLGPESSFRPLGFHRQRTLTRRTKDLGQTYLLKPTDLLPPDRTLPDWKERLLNRTIQP